MYWCQQPETPCHGEEKERIGGGEIVFHFTDSKLHLKTRTLQVYVGGYFSFYNLI